jgi:hypothetical protein
VCILGVLSGCAAHHRAAVAIKPADDALAPQGPVIVRLVGQHQVVMVTAGPNGPLYTAQSSDGRTLVANATLAQLRAENPDVYRFVEPAMAADASVTAGAVRAGAGPRKGALESGATSDRFTREPLMIDARQ